MGQLRLGDLTRVFSIEWQEEMSKWEGLRNELELRKERQAWPLFTKCGSGEKRGQNAWEGGDEFRKVVDLFCCLYVFYTEIMI